MKCLAFSLGLLAVGACGGSDDSSFRSTGGAGSTASGGGGDGATGGGSSSGGGQGAKGGAGATGGAGSSGAGTGGFDPAEDPVADINHPGDMEQRKVGVPIPFIATADDPQDGALGAAAFVWESDQEGVIATGQNDFMAPLGMLGDHVITVTVTDSDGNTGTDSIQLVIVE